MACWIVYKGDRRRVTVVSFATPLASRAAAAQVRGGLVPSSGGFDQASLSMTVQTTGPADYRALVEWLRAAQLDALATTSTQTAAGSVLAGITAGLATTVAGASNTSPMWVVWPERGIAYKVIPKSVSYRAAVTDVAPQATVTFTVVTGLGADGEATVTGIDGAGKVVQNWIRGDPWATAGSGSGSSGGSGTGAGSSAWTAPVMTGVTSSLAGGLAGGALRAVTVSGGNNVAARSLASQWSPIGTLGSLQATSR